jgi:hypothetical protein
MSRRRKRRGGGERFIMLQHWMLKCEAWRTMSANAKTVVLHVWQRYNGSNNGDIEYAVREAADPDTGIGLSKDQASRALIEAAERGFLRITRNSAFRVKTKEGRTWALTALPVGDKPATNDFMHWSSAASQSHQRDRDQSEKSKTRSHQRDARSHKRDCAAGNEIKLAVSVAPARPSAPDLAAAQSHQRDTYIMPWVSPARARGGVTVRESNAGARDKRQSPDEEAADLGGPVLLADVLASMAR